MHWKRVLFSRLGQFSVPKNPSLAFQEPYRTDSPSSPVSSTATLNEDFSSTFQFDLLFLSLKENTLSSTTWHILILTFSVSLTVLLSVQSIKHFEVQPHRLSSSCALESNGIVKQFQGYLAPYCQQAALCQKGKKETKIQIVGVQSKVWTQVPVITTYASCILIVTT